MFFKKIKKIIKIVFLKLLSLFNFILPKKKNLIFMADAKGVSHSLVAIFKDLYDKKPNEYKIKYYVDKKLVQQFRAKYAEYKNVSFTQSRFKAVIYRLIARVFLSEFIILHHQISTPKRQIVIHLWHGMALKKIGRDLKPNSSLSFVNKTITFNLCYSAFGAEIMKRSFNFDDKHVLISQNPRCDLMFNKKEVFASFGIQKNEFKKIVFWLPTFRKSSGGFAGNVSSDINFPLLNSDNFFEFNSQLAQKQILVIIKLHPEQVKIDFLNQEFSNVKTLSNEDYFNTDVEFYEMVGQCDALVTDYSSIAYDFMLLDRPICYVIDDYKTYEDMRGFNVENALDFMPGHQVYTMQEFYSFFDDIANDKDIYREKRNKVNDYVNQYHDARNCERVLNACGIKTEELTDKN